MKKVLLLVLFLIAGSVAAFLIVGASAFGSRPSEDDLVRFEKSPQFNKEKKVFQNRRPHLHEDVFKRLGWKDYIESLRTGIDRVPVKKLPQVKPDLQAFLAPSEDMKVIWLGHSSLLLNVSGKIILMDPVFAPTASPYSFMIRRFQDAPISMTELPAVDYVLISHDHYDHLDKAFVEFLTEKTVTKFIVPLGVGAHLKGWGIGEDRIEELDWWQSSQHEGITFTATPAQHASGRSFFKANETLWLSWVIKGGSQSLFFSGDTGYDTHFAEIGSKLGPFDVAFIDNGQYNLKWKELHLLPEESLQAFVDLKAKVYFPIHWGTFNLAWHPWYEPVTRTQKLAAEKGFRYVAPKMGQIVLIDDGAAYTPWWQD